LPAQNLFQQVTTDQLSSARYYLAATSVDNKALFAGGFYYSERVDVYDVETDTWSTDTLPLGPGGTTVATTVGNKALFHSG